MEPLIRLENVSKDYTEGGQARAILRDCNAVFQTGEFTAIRGRSGSGKSTLLNLLAGIDAPSAGDIYIDNVCLTRLSSRDRTLFRRDHLGFVFQFFNLIPTLSVLENVLLQAELAGRGGAALRGQARALLQRMGLADRQDVFPDKLSGGEQQRVAIARALLPNPRLLLADEPTGNLDARTGDEIMDLLDEVTRRAGRTLIMVTHSHRLAQRADRVMVIEEGQLVKEKG